MPCGKTFQKEIKREEQSLWENVQKLEILNGKIILGKTYSTDFFIQTSLLIQKQHKTP